MGDTNTKKNSNLFGDYAEELYDKVLHIEQKDFSKAIKIAESTISTWRKTEFKWGKITENHIVLVAMYFVE